MDAFSASGLAKSFRAGNGEQVSILSDVSVSVPEGTVVAIKGRSGSGKTTLLSILGLLSAPDSGELMIGDQPTAGLSTRRLTKLRNDSIGFVFQTYSLVPHLTALQNVMLPLLYGAAVSRAKIRRQAEHSLRSVAMGDRLTHLPGELSGGEQQRVAIARALANRPGLILADEPTGALDEANAERVVDLLVEQAREHMTALVIVTHDDEVAARADTRYLLRRGQLWSET